MTKNFKSDEYFDQVQRTAEEAERLLGELDDHNTAKDSLTNSFKRPDKFETKDIYSEEHPKGNAFGPILLLTLLIGVPILIGVLVESQKDKVQPRSETEKSVNKPKPITPKVRRYMNTSERDYYEKTLKNASDAVLKAEHESAIYALKTLKRGKYREYSDVDQGLVNNKIIQGQKKIKFLDQPGKLKYWETSEYGAQWFDNSPDNQFKIFVAHSRKCKNPSIVFGFLNKENGPILKRYTSRPKSTLSTIFVPMQLDGRQWITVDKFKCN